jgi:hypothetical protein
MKNYWIFLIIPLLLLYVLFTGKAKTAAKNKRDGRRSTGNSAYDEGQEYEDRKEREEARRYQEEQRYLDEQRYAEEERRRQRRSEESDY